MTVVKAGVWRRRNKRVVTMRPHKDNFGWMGSDGIHNWDDGRFLKDAGEHELDLVEYLGEATSLDTQPSQPQADAAEELGKLQDQIDGVNDDL